MTTSTFPSRTGVGGTNPLPTYTYATLPLASSVVAGYKVRASDLGTNGTELVSNGTRWLPVNGCVTLKALAAPVTGIANSETVVLQALIPAGAWQVNDALRFWTGLNKSGGTDSLNFNIRIGTAGTTADTSITGTAGVLLSAALLAGGTIDDILLESATSARKVGPGGTGGYTWQTGTSTEANATVISSASANALYATVTLSSSGATNTVGMRSGYIQLVTP